MDISASSEYFSVNVGEAQLVPPATPTPQEFKSLSKVDAQVCIRHHIPFVHFYPPSRSSSSRDPVEVIKMALSRALVHYYPLAGRLRNEGMDGKLVVDCCGEGVIFREAIADITLEELRRINGDLRPPFPRWERLLVDDVWGSNFITDSPLLRMQVTRLSCGGFVLAYTLNHYMCDGYGTLQFITAVSEFSQDPIRKNPSVLPSWTRDALSSRSPSTRSMLTHCQELNIVANDPDGAHHILTKTSFKRFDETSFFFSNADIATLKKQAACIENHGTIFDAVVSCLWRARTRASLISSSLEEEDVTKLFSVVDTRFRYKHDDLSKGFYGNTLVVSCATAKASMLIDKPLSYAASLTTQAKKRAVEQVRKASCFDFLEMDTNRIYLQKGAFMVSNTRWFKFVEVDFGWGRAAYAGPARAGIGLLPGVAASLQWHKNNEGVEGLLALVSLPHMSATRFHEEVRKEVLGGFMSTL
ncbi:hypothetical protein Syun_022142 [Stephania yunnanensis]|uniref:Uncharacterized protein n=1 Tax=Stephania yunnanensis TaxID=152371 RepID=A0AAP0NRR9_9MAGN